jgi:hypothetical protein
LKLRFLTVLSLLANAAGLVALMATSRAKPEPNPAPESVVAVAVSAPLLIEEPAPAPEIPEPEPLPWPPFHWADVADENYTNYAANLRSIGCPEPSVRRILEGATWIDLARRIYVEALPHHDLAYQLLADGQAGLEQFEAIFEPINTAEEEREQLLAALLVADQPATQPDAPTPVMGRADWNFPYVAPERRPLLEAIEAEYQTREYKLYESAADYHARSKDREHLAQAKRAELVAMMDEDERAEFQRREWAEENHSQRETLSLIAGSADEMRSLAGLSMDELAQALGPQRLADLQRLAVVRPLHARAPASSDDPPETTFFAIHPRFDGLDRVARRFHLPPTASRSALDVFRSHEETLKTVQSAEDLLPRDRRQLLRALETERDRKMEALYGREAWETYRFHYGDW